MLEEKHSSYQFDAYHVDTARRLLLRDGEPVVMTAKAYDLLLAFVERRDQILSKRELMDHLWPDTAVEENNLSVQVSALRKALGERAGEHRYIVTVPGRGYQFVAEVKSPASRPNGAEGFLPAVPPAEKAPPPANEGRTRHPARFLTLAVVLGLGVLTLAFAAWRWVENKKTAPPDAGASVAPTLSPRSLAVLPFKMIGGGDEAEQYIGLGLADALIGKLGSMTQVTVRPTNAVRQYADPAGDPLRAGRELRVDAVLDGNVQRVGDRLRVTVQLLRTSDGAWLWTEKFDENAGDLFLVQDRVSDEAARRLAGELTQTERSRLARRYTQNGEAYHLYLKGRYFWNKRTPEAMRQAIKYFNEAVERDPNYALAYAGLADCYNLSSEYGQLSPRESYARGKAAARRALELDESLAEAHTALAFAHFNHDWDWAGAEREYRRALELNPSYATAHHWYSVSLAAAGRFDEAYAEARRAIEIDPLSLIINANLGWLLYLGRRYDESEKQLQSTLALDENFAGPRYYLASVYREQGRYAEAVTEFERVLANPAAAHRTTGLAYTYAITGKSQKARALLDGLRQQPIALNNYNIAVVYAGLGEKDEAFRWLERAFGDRSWWLVYLKVDPPLDRLRDDPRFPELMRRVGLSPQS
ncbi:MAG TPA: winged helix-turn-helix domain-containing protein [Pyrinomonadaceae bacterium]|jgi:DNA-binding winged helix-turn-helix (wHTH) protein/TolB-like protein/Flp pilus assembly protein TadD|nr:winged helix-turn-helix domain-containing protein [Pyrinomonadaceae bacterium]